MHSRTARSPRCAALALFAGATALGATAVCLTGGLSAQTRFRVGVDLVQADAVVLDADGRPATRLTMADFTLTVDGQPRAIDSIDYVDAGASPASRAIEAAKPHDAAPQPSTERHIV